MSPETDGDAAQDLPVKILTVRDDDEKTKIFLIYVALYSFFHISAVYGFYLAVTSAALNTIVFNFFLWMFSIFGITIGSHRLWAHRSYKAKKPLQVLLMIATSVACQGTVTNWVRDHRMHHKYTDTNADPHNAKRGFFFSHIGWLMSSKHSEVKRLGKSIFMEDIYNNPVLRFQKKYAFPFVSSLCFIIPTLTSVYFWSESVNNAWHVTMLRFVLNINTGMMVNSVAHKWGTRPYNKTILPVENRIVSFIALGEGFHNYHHSFPWDYRTGEFGSSWLNPSALLIELFAKIGWAYELKTASYEVIQAKSLKDGDLQYQPRSTKNKM